MLGVLVLAEQQDNDKQPFLYISEQHPVKCCKCGGDVPSPGRIAIRTTGEARYYCDCVSEDEMQDIVAEWNNYMKLLELPEEDGEN